MPSGHRQRHDQAGSPLRVAVRLRLVARAAHHQPDVVPVEEGVVLHLCEPAEDDRAADLAWAQRLGSCATVQLGTNQSMTTRDGQIEDAESDSHVASM